MEKIKTKIKSAIPKKLMYFYYLITATRQYLYDIKIRVRDKVYNAGSQQKLIRDLTVNYHIVEKGLTMPETRPGFGYQVLKKLTGLIVQYADAGYNKHHISFIQSVSVLQEYLEFHKAIGFELDDEIYKRLNLIVERFGELKGPRQIRTTKTEYFSSKDAAFDQFCLSRYSVRNYTQETIPLEVFNKCVELAQRSPSFCNRQPTRVHIVKSEALKKQLLELQNGNRGFGHLAETILVITSTVSTIKDIHERNENHLNGGMFIMSLLNALHFHEIAACSLNWSVSNDRDAKARKLLHLPEDEIILVLLSCGYVPDHFSIASSPRIPVSEIVTAHLV